MEAKPPPIKTPPNNRSILLRETVPLASLRASSSKKCSSVMSSGVWACRGRSSAAIELLLSYLHLGRTVSNAVALCNYCNQLKRLPLLGRRQDVYIHQLPRRVILGNSYPTF